MTISLIIPCYNEELNIQKGVLDKIGNYVASNNKITEVLIIDDGSTDNSATIIKSNYLPQFKKFRLIENSHQGKAFAILTGFAHAKGDYVMFSDFDLATPIEEAEKLIKETERGQKIIIGSRAMGRAGAPLLRKIMAAGFIFIRDTLISLGGVHDTQCGFKLFEKKAADNIISRLRVYASGKKLKSSSVSAGFDLEFLFIATKTGYKIVEVPVSWHHVETKNVNFIHDSIDTMRDIWRIKTFDLAGKYNK